MEKFVSIKGLNLVCSIEGDPKNPAIIMLHDFISQRGVWKQTISALQDKYYCIAIDLPGFGASDKPKDLDYGLIRQAQRIISFVDQFGLDNFSIIGHSMGAQIGLYIASVLAPQRILKLVTVNGIVTGNLSEAYKKKNFGLIHSGRKIPNLYRFGKKFGNNTLFIHSFYKYWFYDINKMGMDLWRDDRMAVLNPACSVPLSETIIAINKLDMTQHLRKILSQSLIIVGKQDLMVPNDQALLCQTLIPNNKRLCKCFSVKSRSSASIKKKTKLI